MEWWLSNNSLNFSSGYLQAEENKEKKTMGLAENIFRVFSDKESFRLEEVYQVLDGELRETQKRIIIPMTV